jgi:hypothetical protein
MMGYKGELHHQTYLYNATLYAIFDDKLDGMHWTMLTKTMDAVHRLCEQVRTLYRSLSRCSRLTVLDCWVPPSKTCDQLTQSQVISEVHIPTIHEVHSGRLAMRMSADTTPYSGNFSPQSNSEPHLLPSATQGRQ